MGPASKRMDGLMNKEVHSFSAVKDTGNKIIKLAV